MAEEKTDTKSSAVKNNVAEKEAKPKEIDYVASIGRNFNLTNAAEIFGKANAERAIRAAQDAGAYGEVTTRQLSSGLLMPKGETAHSKTMIAKINTALNNLK